MTEAAALDRHTPNQLDLVGDPIVTIEFHYMSGVDWLAGRDYTMIQLWWPAVFRGENDDVTGRFLAAMWENLADPIISGRDEVGQPKLYADIPKFDLADATYNCTASWMGFRFLDMRVRRGAGEADVSSGIKLDGTLMLKYHPRVGDWGQEEVCQVTFTPAATPDLTVKTKEPAEAHISFHRAEWSDLPTMHHIVNSLANLPQLSHRNAFVAETIGGKSYRDTRILR